MDAQIADNLTYLVERKTKQSRTPKTKDAIAKDAGMDRTTLWRLMEGKTGMTESNLLKLAKALGVQPWRLLVGLENPHDRFPNIEVPQLRKKHTYSRIEGVMRSDKEIARFFGGMNTDTLKHLKPNLEKLIKFVKDRREKDIKRGLYQRKKPLYPHIHLN